LQDPPEPPFEIVIDEDGNITINEGEYVCIQVYGPGSSTPELVCFKVPKKVSET
jgi:hypothetical protein